MIERAASSKSACHHLADSASDATLNIDYIAMDTSVGVSTLDGATPATWVWIGATEGLGPHLSVRMPVSVSISLLQFLCAPVWSGIISPILFAKASKAKGLVIIAMFAPKKPARIAAFSA